jgi:2-oxoglutarate ferredoxin oxidoreductase subunit alpha
MVDKRFRKAPYIKQIVEIMDPIKVYGPSKPDITIVGWGSTKGPVLESLGNLREVGINARFVHIRIMEPFPKGLGKYLKGNCILFENNRSAELGTLIKLNTSFKFEHVRLRYDGRPFKPQEIVEKVKEVMG